MRFKVLIILLAAVCMAAGPALAKTPPKSCDYATPKYTPSARAYFEGFEGGSFPPAGWTQTVTNAGYTWQQDCVMGSAYEGLCQAYIPWQAGVPQYEVLSFSHAISTMAGEDHLTFATMGSNYWCTYADLTVAINGTQVWSFCASTTTASFTWEVFDIDLSAYDGQTVAIDFIYAGDDGADHHLDAVQVTEEYVPPPPPPGEDCSDPISIEEQGLMQWTVDLCEYEDDLGPGEYPTSCTGYTAAGSDAVYSIYLLAGETFYASEEGPHDMALYLVTDCYSPETTCVVGSDNCCSGATESISYLATASGTYYLIVDGYSGCGLVTVTIEGVIPTEDVSWGALKSSYR
jgi:hypothetical protein